MSCSMLTDTYREGPTAKYHYMVCGVQGDFTQGLVANPPTTLWTRELKVRYFPKSEIVNLVLTVDMQFAGVSHSSTLYKRGIRVCTGTGIGAALSTCIQVSPFCCKHRRTPVLPVTLCRIRNGSYCKDTKHSTRRNANLIY
jgi:hypothetical protein